MLVQYKRTRFCAETKAEFITTGSNPNWSVMTCSHSLRIRTFSSRNKTPGLYSCISRRIRTYSKNRTLRGSLKFNCFPAKLNPWHGEPPIRRSMWGRSAARTPVTLPSCTVSGKLCCVCCMANLSISEAKYLFTLIPASLNAICPQLIPSKRESTFIPLLLISSYIDTSKGVVNLLLNSVATFSAAARNSRLYLYSLSYRRR